MTAAVITDREVQLARERARKSGDVTLVEMLQQLLDYRRHARKVIAAHDYRTHYNREMPELNTLVDRSGCEWWQCDQRAETRRMRAESHSRGEAAHLCCAHADEGEAKGLWDGAHPMTVAWRKDDYANRDWKRRRDTERAQECNTP